MAEPTSMTLGTPAVRAVTSSSAQSAAIGSANSAQPTGFTTMRLCATADCWLALGTDPTAAVGTAGSFLLPAGVVEYIDVPFGYKIAAITAATATLSITPCTKG